MPALLTVPREPKKKAVLVGISYKTNDNLKDNGFPEQPGTHEDVKNLRDVMIDRFNWNSDDIRIMTDESPDTTSHEDWPTQDNILRAMNKLVDEATEGDCIVFAFSGHGGQVNVIDDPDEVDGFDEVLLPVDATYIPRLPWENKDTFEGFIRDDDIRDIFDDRLRPGVRCVLIFDCCHSGTASDLPTIGADDILSPTTPVTPVSPLFSPRTNVSGGFLRGQTIHDESQPPATITTILREKDVTSWSACLDNQLTYGGRTGGIFMRAFVNALRSSPTHNFTYSELLKRLRKELESVTQKNNEKHKGRADYEPCIPPRPQLGSLQNPHHIWHMEFSL